MTAPLGGAVCGAEKNALFDETCAPQTIPPVSFENKSPLGIQPNFKMNNFNPFFICRYLHNIMRLLFPMNTSGAMTAPLVGQYAAQKNNVI